MRTRNYLVLFAAGLLINLIICRYQQVPSYMDAAYYYANGTQIATQKGFVEPFIWNYLDDPAGLPHPSHLYWMPLTSLVSALGMLIGGRTDFISGRIIFILLASSLPLLTAYMSLAFKPQNTNLSNTRSSAWLAGLLALFPGYYANFTSATDSFTLCMILGSLFIITAHFTSGLSNWRFLVLGCLAGLLHLTRADGILWFAAALALAGIFILKNTTFCRPTQKILPIILVVCGYVLFMGPWYWRNLNLFNSLFPPGGSKTIWLLNYDQIFSYPASYLSFNEWWQAGLGYHIGTWLRAFWANTMTMIGVQGIVFLLPMMVIGLWRLRNDARIIMGVSMWALILAVMTVVFPYPGARGGYLHSSAAIQPMLWAVTGYGLDRLIELGVTKRKWDFSKARRFFGAGVVFICALITVVIFYYRQVGPHQDHYANRIPWDNYLAIEHKLTSFGIKPEDGLLINNPPLYYAVNGRPSFVIPDGDVDALLTVANRYQLQWMVLEKDHVLDLDELYNSPNRSQPGLDYLGSSGKNKYFFINIEQ